MELLANLSLDQIIVFIGTLLSVTLGGLISFTTAYLLQKRADKSAEEMRIQIKQETNSFYAHQGFVKLLQYANSAYSLQRAINNQFDDAAEAGNASMEPVQKVQEILGAEANFESFLSEELVFLLHSKDAQLLGDLIVFEKRVLGHIQGIGNYNEKRAALFGIIEEGLVGISGESGTIISSELKGSQAIIASVQSAALNNLLGILMEQLERDVEDGKTLLNRYKDAAKEEYKELFPNLKLEV